MFNHAGHLRMFPRMVRTGWRQELFPLQRNTARFPRMIKMYHGAENKDQCANVNYASFFNRPKRPVSRDSFPPSQFAIHLLYPTRFPPPNYCCHAKGKQNCVKGVLLGNSVHDFQQIGSPFLLRRIFLFRKLRLFFSFFKNRQRIKRRK